MNYLIREKEAFTLTGYGMRLTSSFQDREGTSKEKEKFLEELKNGGQFEQLKALSSDGKIYHVNETAGKELWYDLAIKTEEIVQGATRTIEFQKSEYVIIQDKNTYDSMSELLPRFEAEAFQEILPEITHYEYFEGPNTISTMEEDGTFIGEMLIPVAKRYFC